MKKSISYLTQLIKNFLNIFFKNIIIVFVLNVVCITASSQGTDIMVLKKRNGRTMKTFVRGSSIQFIDISGHKVSGTLFRIAKDSLYLLNYDIRSAYTMWGTMVQDTVSANLTRYHFRELTHIAKPPRSFEFVRNGTLFMLGGTSYAVLHTVNGAIKKEPLNVQDLAISGGIAVTGFLMMKLRKYYYPIGDRYRLNYIDMDR